MPPTESRAVVSPPPPSPRRTRYTCRAVAALSVLLAAPALAQPAPGKRTEGRYFVELAEIMLSPQQFDILVATIDPGGPGAGGPAEEVIADLSKPSAEAPRVTIGLNRPSGKTQISVTAFDFDIVDERIPLDFEAQDQVVTTPLLPPGIRFERQGLEGTGAVPNVGNEVGFRRRADFKMVDFTLQHNIKETKRHRLRWIAGLRYAQLQQTVGVSVTYTPEIVDSGFDIEAQQQIQFPFIIELQDVAGISANIETHGLGPKLGLNLRTLVDKKKKWSFEATADVALLPESSSAQYLLSLQDSFATQFQILLRDGTFGTVMVNDTGAPILPGVTSADRGDSAFVALVHQSDFTETTWLATGQFGFRYQANRVFSVGLDAWQMRWFNLLSTEGVLQTVHDTATFSRRTGNPDARDPQLRDTEDAVTLARFSQRDDFVFDGVSLNLRFDF